MSSVSLLKIIKILAMVGGVLAIYLLGEQIFLPAFQPCRINSVINCDAIISGPVSKTLGLPTPLFGLVGYGVILFASFWNKKKLLFGMAVFGVIFCLWIAYQELFILHVICPICITCQIIMLSEVCLAFALLRTVDSSNP